MKNLAVMLLFFSIFSPDTSQKLTKEYINPSSGYTNIVAAATGKVKTLYVAGQVGNGEEFDPESE